MTLIEVPVCASGRLQAGSRHHDILRDYRRREDEAEIDAMSGLGEDFLTVGGGEGLGLGAHGVAAGLIDLELEFSGRVAGGGGKVFAALHQGRRWRQE